MSHSPKKYKTNTKETLRELFSSHAIYTKEYVESALHNLPDLAVITLRLLKNQDDIGNFLGSYIGVDKGAEISMLLREHILAAAAVVTAAKTGIQADVESTVKALFQNSIKVAKYFSDLNPCKLPCDEMEKMFHQHNQYLIDIVLAHLDANYDEETKLFDAYYAEILSMSDSIDKALCPQKFEGIKDGTYWIMIVILVIVLMVVIIVILYFFKGNGINHRYKPGYKSELMFQPNNLLQSSRAMSFKPTYSLT
jgi:hypothetical protein